MIADENELPEEIQRRGNGCQGTDDDAKTCSIFEVIFMTKYYGFPIKFYNDIFW